MERMGDNNTVWKAASVVCLVLSVHGVFGQDRALCTKVPDKQNMQMLEGTLSSGETFSERFGPFEFRLVPDPADMGWLIEVVDTERDFDISRLTPPRCDPDSGLS